MNIKFGFSFYGLIIFIIPILVNILYCILPPKEERKEQPQPIWDQIENASRILYAVCMCVIVTAKSYNFNSVFFYGMVLFIALYYIVWARYFICGRSVKLLGTKFLFVPMPLAVFPVLYFLCGALWLNNYIAAVIMVIFGIAHNVVSYKNLYVSNQKQ